MNIRNPNKRSFQLVLVAALASSVGGLHAASTGFSRDGIYRLEAKAPVINVRPSLPYLMEFQPFTANLDRIKNILAKAPPAEAVQATIPDFSPARTVEFSVPMPEGGKFERFLVEEVAIMDPALGAKYPEIRTYRGRGIDNRGLSLALDVTPEGMHGYIRGTAKGAVYIDPYYRGNTGIYASYYKSEVYRDLRTQQGVCEFVSDEKGAIKRGASPETTSGTQLRTYRLACAANSTFTNYHGNTVAGGLAGVVLVINRVDAVYEAEVGIRMVLIPNNDTIIYPTTGNPTNGADPYTNDTGALNQNQTNLDAKILTANYDIGHVVTTGSGGVAGLGVVCRAGQKARGTTGSFPPIGDAFQIDFVAHEMGHQFGADHTFNGSSSNCGSNRTAAHAYEPGSGSTIMGYAGVCAGTDNLAPNSDAYFSFDSLDAIVTYTTTGLGNGCPVTTATGNTAPTVSAGPNYTIPTRTPFMLTGSATDVDGDPVTYCWEEHDRGAAQLGNAPDNGTSPIFRSFYPTFTPTRIFPKISNLLAGVFNNVAAPHGETIPLTRTALNFRLTARDNRANGGGINTADMLITLVDAGTGFAITSPTTNVTVPNGSMLNVTWNLANTNLPPVSTANVKISLSTDGGYNFPYVLSASTANDGSETVTIPAGINTTSARLKVEPVGNIYLAISPANFTVN